jgi:hypothetical protein
VIRNNLLALAVATCAFSFGSAAYASIHNFDANLDGLQMTPPNASPAFGFSSATLDDVSGTFTIVTGTYQDLLGGATGVQLFDGAPGVPGTFVTGLTLDTPGAATGTFSGSTVLSAGQITDMLADNLYVRIGSSVYPGGEIRGQFIQAVPEPSSIVLVSVGGIAILGAAWRRRKRTVQ